ncbi:zinc ABC transporter substrate-binding protein [Tropicimonas sp. IMCC34011]|uniref:zinc ABC transporter substrate-binding protein n=1 Tax=Tropicimonas sp. IMCC34011 TaxID=2248759 RepID=UPI000E227E6C|nr:zinc ABC transporter substrate-binding protein [Tropicimonas sp. IMCC34011]
MSVIIGKSLAGSVLAIIAATAVSADVPQVATDIAPVHGLVARVMDGLGEPDLVVRPGASPHGYAMRPSEAGALDAADAVFWIGAELEPWLGDSIDTLSPDARIVELLDVDGTTTLDFRDGATFEAHDHDHDHDHAHDHDHDGHDHAGHSHEGTDPHAWLDPENGKVWLDVIAEELAELDPENAETYRENAAAGREEIDAAMGDVEEMLSSAGAVSFVVFHDAYHYFENRFGIFAAGAISLGDASDPSPARVEEVRDTVVDLGVTCVFSEPQFNQNLVQTVIEGTDAETAVIDPLGFDIETGPGFYPALIRSLGENIAGCTSSS